MLPEGLWWFKTHEIPEHDLAYSRMAHLLRVSENEGSISKDCISTRMCHWLSNKICDKYAGFIYTNGTLFTTTELPLLYLAGGHTFLFLLHWLTVFATSSFTRGRTPEQLGCCRTLQSGDCTCSARRRATRCSVFCFNTSHSIRDSSSSSMTDSG